MMKGPNTASYCYSRNSDNHQNNGDDAATTATASSASTTTTTTTTTPPTRWVDMQTLPPAPPRHGI